jgi:hypothetical protein
MSDQVLVQNARLVLMDATMCHDLILWFCMSWVIQGLGIQLSNRSQFHCIPCLPLCRPACLPDQDDLSAQLGELRLKSDGLEKEKEFYYSKLRDIELLCQVSKRLHGVQHTLQCCRP